MSFRWWGTFDCLEGFRSTALHFYEFIQGFYLFNFEIIFTLIYFVLEEYGN